MRPRTSGQAPMNRPFLLPPLPPTPDFQPNASPRPPARGCLLLGPPCFCFPGACHSPCPGRFWDTGHADGEALGPGDGVRSSEPGPGRRSVGAGRRLDGIRAFLQASSQDGSSVPTSSNPTGLLLSLTPAESLVCVTLGAFSHVTPCR